MKLFSATQVKTAKDKTTNAELVNQAAIAKKLKAELGTLGELKLKLGPEREKLLKAHQEFLKRTQEQRATLLGEIKGLEARREAAKEPLDNYRILLLEREAELNEDSARLSVRGKVLRHGEAQLTEDKVLVEAAKAGLGAQGVQLHKDRQELSRKAEELQTKTLVFEAHEQAFRNSQATAERELRDKTNLLLEKEATFRIAATEIDSRRKQLEEYRRQLDDRAGTLDRAWEEFRIKQQ